MEYPTLNDHLDQLEDDEREIDSLMRANEAYGAPLDPRATWLYGSPNPRR